MAREQQNSQRYSLQMLSATPASWGATRAARWHACNRQGHRGRCGMTPQRDPSAPLKTRSTRPRTISPLSHHRRQRSPGSAPTATPWLRRMVTAFGMFDDPAVTSRSICVNILIAEPPAPLSSSMLPPLSPKRNACTVPAGTCTSVPARTSCVLPAQLSFDRAGQNEETLVPVVLVRRRSHALRAFLQRDFVALRRRV